MVKSFGYRRRCFWIRRRPASQYFATFSTVAYNTGRIDSRYQTMTLYRLNKELEHVLEHWSGRVSMVGQP